jgi:hypothetical protein
MKKVIFWIVIAFIVFFIAFNPNEAADVALALWGLLKRLFSGFGTFFTEVVT